MALVTGASRGIGRAIAASLASAGAQVMISSRKAEALAESKEAIEAAAGAGRRGVLARGQRRGPRTGRGLRGRHRGPVRVGRHPGQQRGHQPLLRADHRAGRGPRREDGPGQPDRLPRVGPSCLAGGHVRAGRGDPQPGLHRRSLGRRRHRLVQRDQGGRDPSHQPAGRRARPPGTRQRPGPPGWSRRSSPGPCGSRARSRSPDGCRCADWGSPRTSPTPPCSCARTRPRGSPATPW